MPQFLTIKIFKNVQQEKNWLQAGAEIACQLGLSNDQVISLCVGLASKRLTVKILPGSIKANKIGLHPSVLRNMRLTEERDYGIRRDANNVRLGPLIGIMANKSSDLKRPFGGQSLFISQLITQARLTGAICFAFYSRDVDFAKGIVKGCTYVNNSWKTGTYRLPDVIYPREKFYSRSQRDIRNKLLSSGCQFLNPPWLGKWQSYKILSKNESLRPYIPDTCLIKSFKQVEAMLKKYQVVYLKPISGSQGKNIIRVTKSSNSKLYKYQYQMINRTISSTAPNLNELERSLRKIMLKQIYIVQQQIKLLESNGRIVDMRVLTQKNDQGKWIVSGMAFRIGKAGSITSNISSGGSGCSVNDLLTQFFSDPDEVERIIREVDFLAVEVAKTLEKNYLPIGELGIDIGIDHNGRVWYIEANLKPARHVFSLIGETETRQLTVQMPILYARYLAGFK